MNRRSAVFILLVIVLALLTLASGAVLASGRRAPTATWVVNNTEDESGPCTVDFCSLRQAIEAANGTEGDDTITFEIPTDDPGYDPEAGKWTILLESALPTLSDPDSLIVDATVGRADDCSTYVILDATNVSYGLEITGANKAWRGVVIKNAQTHGLYIHGAAAQSNTLACSYVISNAVDGVHIAAGAAHNTIGDTTTDQPNVIALNGSDGVEITNGAHHNTLVYNIIGADLSGSVVRPNDEWGVRISGDSTTNTVGLIGQAGNNLISGNVLGGVLISGSGSRDNVIQNNRIGTDSGGAVSLGNQDDGVVVASAPYNTVGPDNLISGHRRDGVRVEGGAAAYNVIRGNKIGTDANGNDRVTNGRFGVWLDGESNHTTVGTQTQGNLISGNGYEGDYAVAGGVRIIGSDHNVLCNNGIGVTGGGGGLPNGGPGGRVEAGGYALNYTIGQPVVGVNSEGDYALCAGFWCGGEAEAAPEYEIYLPLVVRNF